VDKTEMMQNISKAIRRGGIDNFPQKEDDLAVVKKFILESLFQSLFLSKFEANAQVPKYFFLFFTSHLSISQIE